MNLHRGLARLGLVLNILMAVATAIVLAILYMAPGLIVGPALLVAGLGFATVFGRGREMFTFAENPGTARYPVLAFLLFLLHGAIVAGLAMRTPFFPQEIVAYAFVWSFAPLIFIFCLEKMALFFFGLYSYVINGFRSNQLR